MATLFSNIASYLGLVTAILADEDEAWLAEKIHLAIRPDAANSQQSETKFRKFTERKLLYQKKPTQPTFQGRIQAEKL